MRRPGRGVDTTVVKIAGRDVPTPLLIGGVAGVGILVLGQRLTGEAPAAPAAATDGGAGAVPSTSAGVGDLWGDSEVGQFPSFPAAGGGASAAPAPGGYGWWDDEAPPPAAGPINAPSAPTQPPETPISPVAPPPPSSPVSTPPATSGTPYLYASVRAGSYTLYRINWGRAVDTGTKLTTGGFNAPVHLRTVTGVSGSGTTTLMIIDEGPHVNKILYRGAPGITITTRYR